MPRRRRPGSPRAQPPGAFAEAEARDLAGGAWGGPASGLTQFMPAPVLSGVAVTPETALTLASVFSCMEARSTDLAALDLELRRREGKGSVLVDGDVRNDLVYCEPNKDTTPIRFRIAMGGHRFGHGNAYAEIVRYKSGRLAGLPAALHLLSPKSADTYPVRTNGGRLVYKVDAGRRELPAENVIHYAGFGWDGLTGYSVVAFHRQGIGLGIAQQQYASSFYGNSATPGGMLIVKKRLDDTGKRNLREAFEAVHQGTPNSHRVAVFNEDVEWKQFSVTPADAEYLTSRQFEIPEVCRMWQVPPPRIFDYSGVNGVYKGHDDLIQAYIMFTLRPDAKGLEQEFNRKLLTSDERAKGYHFKHDFMGLLAGNLNSFADFLKKRFEMVSITPNEIRHHFGDNPSADPACDRFYAGGGAKPADDSEASDETPL